MLCKDLLDQWDWLVSPDLLVNPVSAVSKEEKVTLVLWDLGDPEAPLD